MSALGQLLTRPQSRQFDLRRKDLKGKEARHRPKQAPRVAAPQQLLLQIIRI